MVRPPDDPQQPPHLESTSDMLSRIRAGDRRTLERLMAIFRPRLERWAHGRLPLSARGLADTEDLVQITLLRVLDQVGEFEARHPGAFLAYLRRAWLNNMLNEIRRARSRPGGEPPPADLPDPAPSPLERAIGRQAVEAYEAALAKLTDEQRAAVILRIELGYRHQEIADLLGSPSANAARMLVARGLARLAEIIDKEALGHGP
jgi:RNA polymerase sigma factor (sigma-70 family)